MSIYERNSQEILRRQGAMILRQVVVYSIINFFNQINNIRQGRPDLVPETFVGQKIRVAMYNRSQFNGGWPKMGIVDCEFNRTFALSGIIVKPREKILIVRK